jgi:Fe2+ or Zn2+ uptake regulation protein
VNRARDTALDLDPVQTTSYGRGMSRSELEALLRAAPMRVTRPRLAVLQAVMDEPHVDADTVIRRLRADDAGPVSHQAVYDVLRVLTEAGLLRRIQPAGATARYEARVDDNHHHLVCRGCGAIVDVECATGRAPCLHASEDHGFVVDEAEVVFWGTCPRCAAASTSTTDRRTTEGTR